MTMRRDVFIFVPRPGTADESIAYIGDWLESLLGHPGYLGGSVSRETANELLPDTIVFTMEFESTEAARTLWPKIENTINPLYPDDKSDDRPDQAPRFFDGTKERVAAGEPLELDFTRGGGRLARMLHLHAAVEREITAVT